MCSFCDKRATGYVNDESGPMEACKTCREAWDADPGFTGNDPEPATIGQQDGGK